jgi:hypothetical protein
MMESIHVDANTIAWSPGTSLFGPGAFHEGKAIVQLKTLSDRRNAGGGIAYLMKFAPPEGKVIKIVAVARSEEHSFSLEGGRGTKTGAPLRHPSDYALNPTGKPHSAFIGTESVFLVIYSGEPDEVHSIEVIDKAAD